MQAPNPNQALNVHHANSASERETYVTKRKFCCLDQLDERECTTRSSPRGGVQASVMCGEEGPQLGLPSLPAGGENNKQNSYFVSTRQRAHRKHNHPFA